MHAVQVKLRLFKNSDAQDQSNGKLTTFALFIDLSNYWLRQEGAVKYHPHLQHIQVNNCEFCVEIIHLKNTEKSCLSFLLLTATSITDVHRLIRPMETDLYK